MAQDSALCSLVYLGNQYMWQVIATNPHLPLHLKNQPVAYPPPAVSPLWLASN